MSKKPVPIYTADLETDPFLKDRKPLPFCAGVYDGTGFVWFWGAFCVEQMIAHLRTLSPGIVYFHNGGKFDIFYMLDALDRDKSLLIIKERITQGYLKCAGGWHKVRDSLKILPFALREYRKDDIDYHKLEADIREQHKDEIVSYLKGDCIYLHKLCTEYIRQFGPSITIGGTAMKELKKFHDVGDCLTGDQDSMIRNRYFFGARVERYDVGVFDGNWKVYDVNSMYPHVMSSYDHPIGVPTSVTSEIDEYTFFITATGYSDGAFPVRTKAGVSFPREYGTFSVTIHEWQVAHELGLFKLDRIDECINFDGSVRFDKYVLTYYGERRDKRIELAAHLKACHVCDTDRSIYCDTADALLIRILFLKFLLNNSYGRFAMNPENFKDYRITDSMTDLRWYGYVLAEVLEDFDLLIWAKPSEEFKYANIAIGASITGAARSVLMKALHYAVRPMYCDTDSIICEELVRLPLHDVNLGAWKLEKTGNRLAMAGRKMYALFKDSVPVKYACKGVKITPEQIERVALGDVVTYMRDSPTFKLSGAVEFLTRHVRMV